MASRFIAERRENLQYVHDMLEQLKAISGAPRGSVLAILLDMARLEAETEMRRQAVPDLRDDRNASA